MDNEIKNLLNKCDIITHFFNTNCNKKNCPFRDCSKERHRPYLPCNANNCKMRRLQNMYNNTIKN